MVRKRKKKIKKLKRKIKKLKKKNTKKIKKKIKKTKKSRRSTSGELVFKVQKSGPKVRILTKINMKKNINYQLKIMKVFGAKREKGLIG
jgi:hypothetical protein